MASFLLAAVLLGVAQPSSGVQFGGRSQPLPNVSHGAEFKAAKRKPANMEATRNTTGSSKAEAAAVVSEAQRNAEELEAKVAKSGVFDESQRHATGSPTAPSTRPRRGAKAAGAEGEVQGAPGADAARPPKARKAAKGRSSPEVEGDAPSVPAEPSAAEETADAEDDQEAPPQGDSPIKPAQSLRPEPTAGDEGREEKGREEEAAAGDAESEDDQEAPPQGDSHIKPAQSPRPEPTAGDEGREEKGREEDAAAGDAESEAKRATTGDQDDDDQVESAKAEGDEADSAANSRDDQADKAKRATTGDQDDDDQVESAKAEGAEADSAANSRDDQADKADTESQTQSEPKVPAGKEEAEEEVSVDTEAEGEPPQAEEGSMEFPTDSGCFLRTPSGCPNHPTFGSRGWRHDTYAEKYTHAKENLSECEVTRKARLVAYCGAEDAETLFVPSIWGGQLGENEIPVEPGCYVRTPTGCPNHPTFNSSMWRHEEYGERATMAKVNRTACEVDRQDSVRHWCGADDAEMLFVPPPPPGCYVRTPSGCPNHQEYSSTEWKHEEFGENFTQARENRTVCEVDRRMHIAHWCGTISVHMLFIPEQQDLPSGGEALRKDVVVPTEPGCYVRTPSGCPNHPDFGGETWEHDRVGELAGARRNRALCEGGRVEQISHWCGTEEVEALFIASPDPGCYVRTPSGCPSHPHYGGNNWTHDEYGEKNRTASVHRIECEVARKAHVVHWCGTDDVQMSFVPPDWESLIVAGAQGGDGGPDGALEPPTQPGCYVRTPSGCPKHPSFESMQWKHEEYGERNTKASVRRSVCEVTRRGHVAHWCGADDVEMLFVPTPVPGCYMRTPSGCLNHPEYGSGTWRRDEDGEKPEESQANRSVCEETRRADIALWCGVEDAETLFIPAAAA